MVAEELGDDAGVAGLGAAGAGAGELQVGLGELAELHVVALEELGLVGDLLHHVVEDFLLGELALHGNHLDGVHAAFADADAAAHAVQRRHGHGELVAVHVLDALDGGQLGLRGGSGGLVGGQDEGTDRGVRADESALVALDALVGVPLGNGDGDAALLVGGGAELEGTVGVIHEGGHGQAVAVHLVHGIEDLSDHLDGLLEAVLGLGGGAVDGVGPGGGNVDLDIGGGAGVDGLVVHVDHVLALLQVGVEGGVLHVLDRFRFGHDLREGEEGALQDRVGALAHADLLGKVDGVDHVELDVVLGNVALGGGVEVMRELLKAPLAVDQEHAVGLDVADDGEALGDVGGNVAGHEVGLVDVVRALDGLVAEAQVAHGHAAGLLGVVLEVGLHELVGVVADDLDGVLVRADGAVAAQTPELALDRAFGGGIGGVLLSEGEVRHVVMPRVNRRFISSFFSSLYTAKTEAGGVSLLPRP